MRLTEMRFGDFAIIQPSVKLEKGIQYPYISMENIEPKTKSVSPGQRRIWHGSGGAKFENGDVLFANSTTGSYLESNTLANTDPLFTDVDNTVSNSFAGTSSYNPNSRLEDDLTLQATSPALTGGGGGSEMGLYNNGFLYNTLGNARGIPTLDIISYDGAVPKNGTINVTINAKAH